MKTKHRIPILLVLPFVALLQSCQKEDNFTINHSADSQSEKTKHKQAHLFLADTRSYAQKVKELVFLSILKVNQ
jgi:hypothetical protein